MRRFLPILVVALFALFTAQPLFVSQLTCSDDNFFALTRAITLEQMISAGHAFSRWSPYMAHGYGFPFFNFYGPLSSLLLAAIHSLGFIYPTALHILFGLCLLGAGLGAYAFAREWWGDAGGVVAAVAYLTAPYLAFDILFRAALAETVALALLPFILFSLHRSLNLRTDTSPSSLHLPRFSLSVTLWGLEFGVWDLLAAISFAALMYTHNTSSLAALPLIISYIALMALLHRDWRKLVRGGVILAFSLALSARFWLPALAEKDLVQTDRLLVPPIFTYYTNFLSLRELFAPPALIDPLLINPSPAKALGLVTTLLALAGFMAVVWRAMHGARQENATPWDLGFGSRAPLAGCAWALIALTAYALLTLPFSQPIWDHVPLVPFIQFPWRLLGPAALCAAFLAGGGVGWLTKHQWAAAAVIALVATLGHLSWWYPRYCEPFKEITIASTLEYETNTFTLGSTAKGEYLPKTVKLLPEDNSIAEAVMRGEQPNYLTGLPADSQLTLLNPDPLDYRATVTVLAPARFTFNQFYFPGWQATLDNQLAKIELTPDTGLITVLVPPGTHHLRFYFGSTPVRVMGDGISIVALIAILTYCLFRLRTTRPLAPQPPNSPIFGLGFWALGVGILSFILLRPLVIDRTSTPLRHSLFDGQTISAGRPVNLNLAGGLTVLSTEYPSSVDSGSQFDAALYLTTRIPTPPDFRPRFDLVSAGGAMWNSGKDALPPRWHREPPDTPYWPVGQYAQWARHETVLPGTPPGEYHLMATVFDRQTLAPDSVIDAAGNATAPIISLGTIQVTRPAAPPALSDFNIQYPAHHDFGPITLLGYNLDRTQARPGDTALITFFFRADETMPDLKFNLLDPLYPTSQWQAGDIWRFQTFARLPASAESGPYHFTLRLVDQPGESFDLEAIQLTAPERTFVAPAVEQPAAIKFGEAIEFVGYTLGASPETTTIDLLWHALATPDADLIAFVHFEDASGHIAAQSDAIPADASRPTTGWLPGEYVLDGRTLPPLPGGDYTMYIGLADRVTGVRLGDRVKIGVYKAP